MKVTVQQMRKSVAGWLREEGATVEQALALESALYAGIINGANYEGKRTDGGQGFLEIVTNYQSETGDEPDYLEDEEYYEDGVRIDCGCLLDTFERIKHGRPTGAITGQSAEAYALAMTIGVGDTPFTSRWSRAAVRGIQDYVAEIGG